MKKIKQFSLFQEKFYRDKLKVTGPDTLFPMIKSLNLVDLDVEVVLVFVLDTRNQVIAIETVSVGTMDSSLVHPREVFKLVMKHAASSFILCHNHPSGNTVASHDDEVLTKRLAKCGVLLGIRLLDHIIVGWEHKFSLDKSLAAPMNEAFVKEPVIHSLYETNKSVVMVSDFNINDCREV